VEFQLQLKQWRQHRRMSQMQLAMDAGLSARHLSFLETGRSRPSEGMILRICDALEIGVGEQNSLLSAAGFLPRYSKGHNNNPTDIPPAVEQAIDLILDRHEPYPAILLNATYTILKANSGFQNLAKMVGIDDLNHINFLDLFLDSDAARNLIVNWEEVARALYRRAKSEAWLQGPTSPLHAQLGRLSKSAPLRSALDSDPGIRSLENPLPVLPVTMNFNGVETSWITTITSFGSARDALVDGLMIEQSFPADEATMAILQGI